MILDWLKYEHSALYPNVYSVQSVTLLLNALVIHNHLYVIFSCHSWANYSGFFIFCRMLALLDLL
jgi:hypothetical protein